MKLFPVLLAAAMLGGCAFASNASTPTYTGRACWSKLIEVPDRDNPEYGDGWSSLTVDCGTANDFEIAKSNGMMVWKRMRVLETFHVWKETTDSTRNLPVVSRHLRYPLPQVVAPLTVLSAPRFPDVTPVIICDDERTCHWEPTDVPAVMAKLDVPCVERSFSANDYRLSCRWFIYWREDFSECIRQATKYEATIYEYFPSCEKPTYTCADKSRVLLTGEDGTKHCIKFSTQGEKP
jgi:hypothetical protein